MKFDRLIALLPDVSGAYAAGNPDLLRVVEDSRQVRPGDLFLARAGTAKNGAAFVAAAVAAGAAAVIGPPEILATLAGQPNIARAVTAHGARTMARAAYALRGNPQRALALAAVTGTNGKTTITYMLRSILRAHTAAHAEAGKCGLIGTVEIDDGHAAVPSAMTTPGPIELADIFSRMRGHGVKYVAMETSSHALHQNRLAEIPFAVAMFTNLTGDHLDYHGSMEAYAAAKAMLFTNLESSACAIINGDDPWADAMVKGTKARVLRYGFSQGHDFVATQVRMDGAGAALTIAGPGGFSLAFNSPLVGRHNVYNTLCAAAAAYALGVPAETISVGLQTMAYVPGRLQPVTAPGVSRQQMPFQVLVDYAHTHDALENVLLALRPMTDGKLWCVFGCGGDRDRTKRPKMAAVAQRLADAVIVTSDNPRTEDPAAIIREIETGFTMAGKHSVQADRRAAIGEAISRARPGDVVLIAGKGHEDYQIIGATKFPFDDVAEARRALRQTLANLPAR